MNILSRLAWFLVAGVGLTISAAAATVRVDSIAALQAAIGRAAPGDRIVVKNGSYTTTAPLKVTVAGTATAPIVIVAESVGGVELTGTNGFDAAKPAAFIVIEGFRFTHASGKTVIGAGSDHVRFSRNIFQCVGDGPYLSVIGDNAEVDRNEFRDKKTLGNMISVSGTGSQVARNLWIHHNYFHDFANAHGNGAETIRFGLSGLSMSRGEGLVEYNLFVHCEGENELISNKSCANTYRYNTFLEAPGAQLTIRHGNDCIAYGNYFRHTDGLRIFGDRHAVIGNFFEGNRRGINLGNGDGEVADGAKLTSHDRPDGTTIAFNTLVDSATHLQMDHRQDGLGATRTEFSRNVLQGGGTLAKIDGPNPGAVWKGNTAWQTGPAGDLPADGFENKAAHYAVAPDGRLVLESGAVVTASQAGSYAAPAPSKLAADARVVSATAPLGTIVRILTPAEVVRNSR
jgi:poly(beta-D-mannuronate) lyase